MAQKKLDIAVELTQDAIPDELSPDNEIQLNEELLKNHDKSIDEHTKQIKKLEDAVEEVKTLKEKVEGHERNVIATMGILFSLFIGISSSLSLFSFAKETPLNHAILIILGVIITNITLATIFVYMIKILFTHHKDEGATVRLIHRLFIRLIQYFVKPITKLVIVLIILYLFMIIHASPST